MIQQHWNKIVKKNWGQAKSRDYITFSDIGKPYIDRYFKMKGEPITNEFSERVLRIFDAGRVMEFIVLRALTMAGILNKKQEFVEIPRTDKALKCLGYLDCTIGGFADWGKAKEIIYKHLQEYKLNLDDQLLEQKAINIIEGLSEEFKDGRVPEMLVEVKSINSMAFWAHKNRDKQGNFLGYPHNKLQLYGYLKASKIEKGILMYISKDDFTLEELGIVNGQQDLEQTFNRDIETMTGYFLRNEVPPKEDEIVFNESKKVFELNWHVSRSQYLTKIYGYKDSVEFEERKKSKLNEINLALKHLREYQKEQELKKKDTLERKIIAEDEIIRAYKLRSLI